jgi:flagellar basal-body rod modification protein FlgD
MTTSVSSASNALADLANSSTNKKTALSDATESQDRFLKLLVAQLNNQDPMNPMDNAQMTSQMAQINTVSGIQQLNETVKSLSSQFTSLQVLQGASMIGHDVLTQGNSLTINAGVAKGAIDLPTNADKVSVQILSPGGQVVDTINLGAKAAGRQNFTWDASNYTSGGNPTFKVTATQGSQTMATTSYAQGTVLSVGNNGTGMTVQLKGGTTVAYDDIKAIL